MFPYVKLGWELEQLGHFFQLIYLFIFFYFFSFIFFYSVIFSVYLFYFTVFVIFPARLRVRRKSGDDIHKLGATATSGATVVAPPATRRRGLGDGGAAGFFDSFRPRSKSDAKAICN